MAQQIYKYAVKQPMAFVNGSCFVNNNSDNVCDVIADFPVVPSINGWAFGTIFKPRLGTVQRFGYGSRIMSILADKLQFLNNIAETYFDSGIFIDEDRYYTLFVRYGLNGTQKYFEIWLDNVYQGKTNITTDGYRFKNALMALHSGTNSVKEIALYNGQDITDEEALNWKGNAIKGGTDELLIPFIGTGTSTTVYDVNNNTPYVITGTVTSGTSWSEQDEYFYCENKGFTSSSPNIPASLKTGSEGKDVLGNVLTNEHIDNFVCGGAEYKQPITPELVHADPFYVYYEPMFTQKLHENPPISLWSGFAGCPNPTYDSEGMIYNNTGNISFQKFIIGGFVLNDTYIIQIKYELLSGSGYFRTTTVGLSTAINADIQLKSGTNLLYVECLNDIDNDGYVRSYFMNNNPGTPFSVKIKELYILNKSDYIGVTAKEKTIDELLNNFNDQIFWNRVSDVQVGQGLLYRAVQSEENQEDIQKCYSKEYDGTVVQLNDGNIMQFNDDNIVEYNN